MSENHRKCEEDSLLLLRAECGSTITRASRVSRVLCVLRVLLVLHVMRVLRVLSFSHATFYPDCHKSTFAYSTSSCPKSFGKHHMMTKYFSHLV